MCQQGPAGERLEHLRQLRIHAYSLAGGQDDDGKRHKHLSKWAADSNNSAVKSARCRCVWQNDGLESPFCGFVEEEQTVARHHIPTVLLAAATYLTTSAVCAEKLDFARVHADPPLSGPAAQGLQVAPDGARVTFLQPRAENQDILDLWQIDVASGTAGRLLSEEMLVGGTAELTPEEEARRQRLRIRAGGITNYSYDETGRRPGRRRKAAQTPLKVGSGFE